GDEHRVRPPTGNVRAGLCDGGIAKWIKLLLIEMTQEAPIEVRLASGGQQEPFRAGFRVVNQAFVEDGPTQPRGFLFVQSLQDAHQLGQLRRVEIDFPRAPGSENREGTYKRIEFLLPPLLIPEGKLLGRR